MKIHLPRLIPPAWARGGHAQTLVGNYWKSPSLHPPGERREVRLNDGDRLVTRYHAGRSPWVIYLFHGLTGSTESGYMRRTAALAKADGHSVYLVNHRGCGEGRGLARGPYHSGRGEDLSRVIEEGRQRHPGHHHLAIGFSLSGNALLCLLTGLRGAVQPDAAIVVNAPIDLRGTAQMLESGFNRIYDFHFVSELRKHVHALHREGLIKKPPRIGLRTSLRDFDSLYTAPAGGFTSNEDYYSSCSTHARLTEVNVPTFMLMAKDDPFVAYAPYATARLSPKIHLHIEETGGHLGYVGRDSRGAPYRWLDLALKAVLRELTAAPPLNLPHEGNA